MEEEILQDAYTDFAEVYDELMDNIPYEDWSRYLQMLLQKENVPDGLLLDLGCGTGKLTRLMEQAGYDMIGVDLSEEMLDVALEERMQSDSQILYLNQDMREFELYGTVAAVYSLCDSMNYLESVEDLVTVLKLVNNYLDPDGVFIFDLKTEHFYEGMGDQTLAENREDCSYIWENNYLKDERVNTYVLTLYIRDEDGRYERSTEIHEQKAFTLEEVKQAISEAGMLFRHCYKAFTLEEGSEDDDRVYFICQEQGKKRAEVSNE